MADYNVDPAVVISDMLERQRTVIEKLLEVKIAAQAVNKLLVSVGADGPEIRNLTKVLEEAEDYGL